MDASISKTLRFIETLSVADFKKKLAIDRIEGGVATKKDGTFTEKFCACFDSAGIIKMTMPMTKDELIKPVISRVIDDAITDAKEFYLLHNQGEIKFTGATVVL